MFLCLIGIASTDSANDLRPDFYKSQCPQALEAIKAEITSAVRKEPAMGLAFFRLHFIDSVVQASLHFPQLLCLYNYEQFHTICINFCMGSNILLRVKLSFITYNLERHKMS